MFFKELKCSVYGSRVLVFADCTQEEALNRVKKEFGERIELGDDACGISAWFSAKKRRGINRQGRYYVIWIGDKKNISVLVHEILHLVMNIMRDKEVKIDVDNQEPFCYYVDHWIDRILKALKGGKKHG